MAPRRLLAAYWGVIARSPSSPNPTKRSRAQTREPQGASAAAKAAGLIYVSDEGPGIRRAGSPKTPQYLHASNRKVKDAVTLGRIKRLAIPPAWTEVWICRESNGHLQATGRDARGRKQYRYHPHWRQTRDETKYTRLLAFARVLPRVRQRLTHDMNLRGFPREKVLATVITILETGLIRVGNDEYARTNNSFGLTTLQDRHVDVQGATIRFQFRGKSGKHHRIDIDNRRLARIVAHCQAIPGQELFQYYDKSGKVRDITSTDVNEYLQEITQNDFTAKDFRTWGGTVLAAMALQQFEKAATQAQARKNLLRAIEAVAQRLGNTPAICRKCYIHPAIIDSYLEGTLSNIYKKRAKPELTTPVGKLKPEEAAVLAFLQKRLDAEQRRERTSLFERLHASVTHRRTKTKKSS